MSKGDRNQQPVSLVDIVIWAIAIIIVILMVKGIVA